MKTFTSDISNKEFLIINKISADSIRQSVFNFIQKTNPNFNQKSVISISELNNFREQYIANFLVNEVGVLNDFKKNVLNSFTDKNNLTDKKEIDVEPVLTTGQRIADKVATFGGSWSFIIFFGVFILFWILVNIIVFIGKPFDPYPFILLNLILSCLAALQAPIIMMSQNRQEEKDRERAKKDYMINLKSELEIRVLHEKIDHIIMHDQQELLEIQKLQIEMMNDIIKSVDRNKS